MRILILVKGMYGMYAPDKVAGTHFSPFSRSYVQLHVSVLVWTQVQAQTRTSQQSNEEQQHCWCARLTPLSDAIALSNKMLRPRRGGGGRKGGDALLARRAGGA